MGEEGKRGLKIFLQYGALFAVLGGVNIYMYFTRGKSLNIVVAALCGAVVVGWAVFYFYYVRKGE